MTTRGIRNCNPLNIRRGSAWQGLAPVQNDPQFCQFMHTSWGLRAAFVILRRYIKVQGCCTLRAIISRWAPASENDTARYIQFVANMVGVDPSYVFQWENVSSITKLVQAMAVMESGKLFDLDYLTKCYHMV